MRINTYQRHFRETFRSVTRNTWSSIASISSVAVTLLIVGAFLMFMMNINHFATKAEENLQIRVLVDITAKEPEREVLKQQLETIEGIESIEFSSKEEEMSLLIEGFGELGDVFSPKGQNNPLLDVYVITAKDPNQIEGIANSIKKFQYVDSIDYGAAQMEKIQEIVSIVRNVGLVMIVGLIFTAMFLISNTIKITIFARSREIEIMRLVGATNNFIRWPFLIEGFTLGFIGSLIPVTAVIFGYQAFYDAIAPKLDGTFFELLPVFPFVVQISILLALIGSLIGMWGSVFSIRKFLKV
ncbi:MAG: permease-like cell division protein FtsX [Bacilli bacterium]